MAERLPPPAALSYTHLADSRWGGTTRGVTSSKLTAACAAPGTSGVSSSACSSAAAPRRERPGAAGELAASSGVCECNAATLKLGLQGRLAHCCVRCGVIGVGLVAVWQAAE